MKNLKIALVTDKKPHHKYWISELYNSFNVELILHPHKKKSFAQKIKSKNLFRYGFIYFLLKLMSIIYSIFSKKSFRNKNKKNELKYFESYIEKYNSIPETIIKNIETVNSIDIIELIKQKNIDVICFLGGDIAKKEFISAPNLISLNYHSGLSPFYNGNKTIFHAVSDFRPNFAGGTLMKINERIDGGEIFSHYLVSINENDTASDLFMKNITGAVELYKSFLTHIESNSIPKGIIQKRSFKYVRNIDWNIANDLKLRKFENKNNFVRYKRNEEIIDYYNDENDTTCSKTLKIILNKSESI